MRSLMARLGSLAAGAAILTPVSACSSSSNPSPARGPTPPPSSSSSPTALRAPQLAPLQKPYAPTIDPANFVGVVDNRYWPLLPGTGFHYRGVRGTTPQTDDEIVLHKTKRIAGITCTVVKDTVSEHGRAVERTFDWYAQDRSGNVWYMGELSLERKNGRMTRASDSWETGVNGGQPGIIMPGDPQPGDAYRQEYYPPGQALDEARVLSLNGAKTVPMGTFDHLLVTSERSPLEPQTEQKYYAPGVGEVAETVVKGHHEAFTLVRVTGSAT